MSLENVKAFYERLASDEDLRTQLQTVKSKEECSQIVKNAGYDFTTDEFEEYTIQLLESTSDNDEIKDLDEKELEAVFGGASPLLNLDKDKIFLPMYGMPYPWPWPIDIKPIDIQPSYGVPISDDLLDELVVDNHLLNEISVNEDLTEH